MNGNMCKFLRIDQIENQEISGGRFKRPPVQANICALKPYKIGCGCDHKDNMRSCPNFQGQE